MPALRIYGGVLHKGLCIRGQVRYRRNYDGTCGENGDMYDGLTYTRWFVCLLPKLAISGIRIDKGDCCHDYRICKSINKGAGEDGKFSKIRFHG